VLCSNSLSSALGRTKPGRVDMQGDGEISSSFHSLPLPLFSFFSLSFLFFSHSPGLLKLTTSTENKPTQRPPNFVVDVGPQGRSPETLRSRRM
jgi:hypothetical protein